MNERIAALTRYLEEAQLDAILLTDPKHVYYFTGYLSDPHERLLALALRRDEEPFLLVPSLDEEAARAVSRVTQIHKHQDTDNAYELLGSLLGSGVRSLGIEKQHLTVSRYELLEQFVDAQRYADVERPVREMRVRKSAEEIAKIKHAVRLVEEALARTIRQVRAGVTEIELAAEADYQMKKLGADGPSFQTTVLAGERSALPHGDPGQRALAEGDLLLFDMGVLADGYVSDITRTFAFRSLGDRLRTVYDTVLQANRLGIEAIRPGQPLREVDQAARAFIEAQSFGPYFQHRVGHGLGMDVHEYPSVHGANEDLLTEGMVLTVEPGIYLPGEGGVRIEDDVLVTASGCEVLTSFRKDLTILE
ncbi:dipeptidase [Paenibacillus sp. J31TS4]|uniref:M24 family metallopeptidase n=1 Tax=Paenibacillus sp. J31TS4 TaxID=2807195 RepID=UPI001B017AA4|nr:Xaa-Pro peptidase family protein [Paenibacillus sp. J31TS4]GIP37019.1 dipeptidase [Paenibacillus sp. J31TS4]